MAIHMHKCMIPEGQLQFYIQIRRFTVRPHKLNEQFCLRCWSNLKFAVMDCIWIFRRQVRWHFYWIWNHTSIFQSQPFNCNQIIFNAFICIYLQRKIAQIKMQRMHPYLLLSTTFYLGFMTENGPVPRHGSQQWGPLISTACYIQLYRDSLALTTDERQWRAG